MKQKTGRMLLSFLLTLAMVIGLLPGMDMTAQASQADPATWSENQNITETTYISTLTVTADITVTIAGGVSLYVTSGIDATDHTLTVAGTGTLIVNGANGSDGSDFGWGASGSNGGAGFKGNIIVNGATVTVTGGNGGNGEYNRYPMGNPRGGNGGNGGSGVDGSVTVNRGSATVTGGNGGNGGGCDQAIDYDGNLIPGTPGTAGTAGKGVTGTLTGQSREESDNGIDWTAISGDTSTKRYVRILVLHSHNFTSYTANGDTITATCTADDCTLTEVEGKHTAKLTIAPSSTGGNTAELTGDVSDFGVSNTDIKYQKKTGSDWQNMDAAPGTEEKGFFKASITAGEKTASVTYGVSTVSHGTATNPTDKSYDFTVPTVATVGAKITPAPTTEFDTGYGIKKITVKDENGTDVSAAVSADTEGFIMPDYNVTVDVEFGLIDYTITKNDTTNGAVTVKKGESEVTTANYGDMVTLVATPDDGFTLRSFMVKDSRNTMIELSGTGNTRTFTMPASDVTVSATFEGLPFNLTIPDEITGGIVEVAGSGVATADNVTTAKAGTEVTLTVTPDTGYDLISDSVTVTKTADSSAVSVTKESDTGYKFIMPTEAVTVSAAFVGRPVSASLNVMGNDETTCKAELLHDDYTAVTDEKPLTRKAGEKFILLVNRDDEYDFNVKYGADSDVSMTEFTGQEYKDYIAYANKNNISVSANTVLAWVTMPGVEDGSVTLTVNFSKLQTFTVLYQPTGNPDSVWCKFTVNSGAAGDNTGSSQMKSDATMGDGSKVYSLKVTAAFAPKSVAFATKKDGLESVNLTECQTKTGTSETDWTTIAGSGKFCVIGGDAKTVIVAFVANADAMKAYKDNTVDAATAADGVTYRVAVVTEINVGTVTAPEAPAKDGYDFAGWRGLEGTAPDLKEKIYNPGDSISVSENTTLNAVWNRKNPNVKLNLNGGTGGTNVTSVAYGEILAISENPTKTGFSFDGWTVSRDVTEDGKFFAKGTPFDLNTKITANLELTAQWNHVHSYSCFRISDFGDRLAKYKKYETSIHVAVCSCGEIELVAHEFDSSGKCACGYQKPAPQKTTLNVSYGEWSNGTYIPKMQEFPQEAEKGQEVSVSAPVTWGNLQFSKWQYSLDGSTWKDLAAYTMAAFLIPRSMHVRALYVNPVTKPQVDLGARNYLDQTVVDGKTYQMDNILFHMNYRLPDGYSFVDAGIRLGDNAGISYYELKEKRYTLDAGGKAIAGGVAAAASIFNGEVTTVDYSATDTYYEERANSVLDEMSAETLAKYMYESKPINVEKYDPIYWQAKAVTKGMSGSIETLPPLRFAQKDGGSHWIYGIGWLRYKDKAGKIQTIYTDALPATVKNIPSNAVAKSGS